MNEEKEEKKVREESGNQQQGERERREETYVALAKLIEKVPAHDGKASTASVLSHDHED